eukprot:Amastigsp_a3460_8.p3 type:complete len:216 gc:universal Amastigsp_a3460_8:1055-408(-)
MSRYFGSPVSRWAMRVAMSASSCTHQSFVVANSSPHGLPWTSRMYQRPPCSVSHPRSNIKSIILRPTSMMARSPRRAPSWRRNHPPSMAWPGLSWRPSVVSTTAPSGATTSITHRMSSFTKSSEISRTQRSRHARSPSSSPRLSASSWAVTSAIIRGAMPISGRVASYLGGMRPGVKLMSRKRSKYARALAADSAEPVARACAANAIAAKLSLYA